MFLLWVIGYLAVGFVVAVLVERYWPTRIAGYGPPIAVAFWGWPLVLLVLLAFAIARCGDVVNYAVRYCARRLP